MLHWKDGYLKKLGFFSFVWMEGHFSCFVVGNRAEGSGAFLSCNSNIDDFFSYIHDMIVENCCKT
jgi:hypothetical protein